MARRDGSQIGLDLWLRFGARGPGTVVLPEYGLRRMTVDELTEWAATRFSRANAAVWMTGAPPPGLRLRLGEGPPAPPPVLQADIRARRAWAGFETNLVSVTVATIPSPGRLIVLHVAEQRARRALRDEGALSYSISSNRVELPDGSVVEGLYCDFAPGHETEVRDTSVEILEDLANDGVTCDELNDYLRYWRRLMADRRSLPDQLDYAARTISRNRTMVSVAELTESFERIAPGDCGLALADGLPSTLIVGPSSIDHPPAGFTDYPQDCDAVVEGRRYRPVPGRAHGVLIVGDQGVSRIIDDRRVRTVRFADCEVLAVWGNGRRELIGGDGNTIQLIPQSWWDIDDLDRLIDGHIPTNRVVEMGPGDPAPDRPRSGEPLVGSGDLLAALPTGFRCGTVLVRPPRAIQLSQRPSPNLVLANRRSEHLPARSEGSATTGCLCRAGGYAGWADVVPGRGGGCSWGPGIVAGVVVTLGSSIARGACHGCSG